MYFNTDKKSREDYNSGRGGRSRKNIKYNRSDLEIGKMCVVSADCLSNCCYYMEPIQERGVCTNRERCDRSLLPRDRINYKALIWISVIIILVVASNALQYRFFQKKIKKLEEQKNNRNPPQYSATAMRRISYSSDIP